MKIKHLLIGLFAVAAAVACKQDEPVETPKLDVDKTAVSLAATAGEASFNVTSNQSWVASADADWVSLEPASGQASEKAVAVKVTAEDNETTEARKATVTVKAGELTKTVTVNQAAGTGEEPGPDAATYFLVGDAVGGWNFDNPVVLTLTEGYYVAKSVAVTAQKGMHFTKNDKWEGNVKGLHGLIAPNEIGEVGSNDISLTEGGNFDVYLTEALDKFYFMSEGKLPSEAVEHVEIATVWGVCGAIEGNSWGNSADPVMEKEGEWFVAKNVVFTEVNFKVRGNNSWADDLKWGSVSKDQKCELNKAIAVSTCAEYKATTGTNDDNPNVYIEAPAGTYDIYFSPDKKEVWVMTPGYKPGDDTPEPEVTYTVTGTIKGTDADKKANYWKPSNEPGLMALEGDYYVAKNVEFDYDYRFNDDGTGEDFVKFKICETGTWNAYGQAEEAINKPNTEIAVLKDGKDIYLNKSGVYDVYFDKTNGKVWVMEAGYKPGEEIARLDGYQWMAEANDMQILFDLGVTEEGMVCVALPTMDGTGFGLHMAGLYEIEATDKSSGVIYFTQYDWEWDELGEEYEFTYSDLTTTTVKLVCETIFGVADPVTLTRVENPYEIQFDGGSDEPEPQGPVADGYYRFLHSGSGLVMAPLAADATSGKAAASAEPMLDENKFLFTYDPDASGYTIQDIYGRYLGQSAEVNFDDDGWAVGDICVATELPSGEDYYFYVWVVDNSSYEDGTVDVYNMSMNCGIGYSAGSWSLTEATYETAELRPTLVPADVLIEAPVTGPQAISVADFLNLSVGTTEYQLTGVMEDTYNTTYGNFYLNDGTGKVFVYGLTATKQTSNDKSFASLGLKDGDTITIIGTRDDYNGTAQVGGPAYLVSCEKTAAWDAPAISFVNNIVTLVSNEGAAIYYTLDGTTPSESSQKYSEPFEIQETVTVNAIAVKEGRPNSSVATKECEYVEISDDVVVGGAADFATISATNTSYVTGTTTAGWNYKNCAIFKGGTSDSSPAFKMIGDASNRALCMNGKTSAVGSITSPTLTTGCGTLTFNYGLPFGDTKIMFRVDIMQNGSVVKTFTINNASATKLTKYSHSEAINVSGDFQIVFTNLSPSNSTSNKDRTAIWDVEWTGYKE